MAGRLRIAVAIAATAAAALTRAPAARAQQPLLREPAGFDFTPNGVWRPRARAVRGERMRALARGDNARANAPMALRAPVPAQFALTGTLRVPVFLVRYGNSPDTTLLNSRTLYDQVLFATTPPLGRPYTIRTFYEEMSNGLFSMQGQVLGWLTLLNSDTYYEGNNNGLNSSGHVAGLILEAAAQADAAVNFGQFDNDGPDGVPNSGDDDGEVDLAVFVHPELGGECTGNLNIWSHRWSLQGWGFGPFVTNDPRNGGGSIRINNYTIQGGVGGATSCNPAQIMPVGAVAHETGHGLGLPDLYDDNPGDADNSEGIGEWGLMGSGMYARPLSPAHMEAWSKVQLGWVTVRTVTAGGTYTLGPTLLGDTVLLVRPTAPNPRGEYFLLENRQAVGADTALIDKKGGTGGMLIWHVDSLQAVQGGSSPNSGSVHMLWLMQADGLDQLRSSVSGVRNRGDGGDVWPGTTGATRFSFGTTPSTTLNGSGAYAGFVVDSIRQVVPNAAMAFRLRFAGITLVSASDTGAAVRVRGIATFAFRDVLDIGDTATIEVDSVQVGNGGRTEYRFVSWSDAGARAHQISGSGTGDTVTASVSRRHRIAATTVGSGSVTPSPAVSLAGTFVAEGDTVTLTAVPAAGLQFVGWSGPDTAAAAPLLRLRMARPFTVTATFQAALAVLDSVMQVPLMGAPYLDTLRMSGGAGTYTCAVTAGLLPAGLQLSGCIIFGVPSRDSTYDLTITVQSGAQSLAVPLRFAVTAPNLALAAVVNQFLTGAGTLSANDLRYLDQLGNTNLQFDLGDLVAWLDRTGNQVSAAVMRDITGRATP